MGVFKGFWAIFLAPMVSLAASTAGQGVVASYLRLQPTSLPTVCRQGDVRFDTSTSLLQVCNGSNAWGAVGGSASAITTLPVPINQGGTANTTAAGAINALLPTQTSHSGAFLTTNGSAASWVTTSTNYPSLTTDGQLAIGDSTGAPDAGTLTGTANEIVIANGHGTITLSTPQTIGTGSSPTFAGLTVSSGSGLTVGSGTGIAKLTSGVLGTYTLVGSDLPNPSASTLGGIESYVAVSHQWLSAISTAGVPSSTQPAFTDITGTLGTGAGGTGVTSVTTAPTASSFAGWDANSNLSANNHINKLTSTATAAGTTTLTVASTYNQVFTGSTTQTLVLPVASTLAAGQGFWIQNVSTGVVTVQTSGSNSIQAMASNTSLFIDVINTAGGTGTASWDWVYAPQASSALVNPMTTLGDIIYGGASGTATRLAGNITTTTNILTQTGNGSVSAAPAWFAMIPPTISTATATGTGTGGFGGSQTGWVFTVSAWTGTLAIGDTYTNNAHTYTVQAAQTNGTGQTLFMSGTGATSGSTLTKAVSASGPATITFSATVATATYTTPTSPRSPIALRVRAVGGGGGGGGGGTSGGTGTGGGLTLFGPVMVTASGGTGGTAGGTGFANGGTGAVTTVTALAAMQGGGGGNSSSDTTGTGQSGTQGGGSYFGGQGAGGSPVGGGQSGGPNTGGGGGGGGSNVTAAFAGGGGGSGGYAEAQISGANILVTFPYAVSTTGAGGTAGTGGQAGGAGAAGDLIVEEIYQ